LELREILDYTIVLILEKNLSNVQIAAKLLLVAVTYCNIDAFTLGWGENI
jgi:hypothetical protein